MDEWELGLLRDHSLPLDTKSETLLTETKTMQVKLVTEEALKALGLPEGEPHQTGNWFRFFGESAKRGWVETYQEEDQIKSGLAWVGKFGYTFVGSAGLQVAVYGHRQSDLSHIHPLSADGHVSEVLNRGLPGQCDVRFAKKAGGLVAYDYLTGDQVLDGPVTAALKFLQEAGLKLHPKTIALVNTWRTMTGRALMCASDIYIWDFISLIISTNGLIVQRWAVPIGYGFRDGAPILILAKPNFDKENCITSFSLQEQRIGKYYQAFVGDLVDPRKLIEDLKPENTVLTTHLCYTQKEWYGAYAAGPVSCMTGYSYETSPVRVYCSGDNGLEDNNLRLFIAYSGELFGEDFEVRVRAIVNEETKEYVRAYGINSDGILRARGYTRNTDCTDGCIIARIPHPDKPGYVLMAYQDGNADQVDEHGDDAFALCYSGDYSATDASGYIYVGQTERTTCSCCGDYVDEDDAISTNDGDVCENCLDDRYRQPMNRDDYYHVDCLSFSDYHGEWVHDDDAAECYVRGVVSTDECTLVFASDICSEVCDDLAEYQSDGNYYLTESACADLCIDYHVDEEETIEED